MSILKDLGMVFRKPNNHLMQLITVLCGIYVVFGLFDVAATLSGYADLNIKQRFFSLSAFLPNMLRQPWTVLSYGFLHAGLLHLIFNMLFLYWFGQLVSEYLGSSRVIGIFVLGVMAGGLAYLSIYNLLPYYKGQIGTSELVGASGGIFAVVWAAATLLPNYSFRILLLGFVKIRYIALFYTLLSVLQLSGSNAGGNLAHLGGAAMGVVYLVMLQRGYDLGAWVASFLKLFDSKKPMQRKRPVPSFTYASHQPTKKDKTADQPLVDQSEVDRLLDKIGQSGYESLTKEEKHRLFKASQQ
jgi:membrane associated rhomboid family serine protease